MDNLDTLLQVNIPCLFRTITGIPCPGCGLTRAYISAFHGDLKTAWYFHPLWWTIPILVIVALKVKNQRIVTWVMVLFMIVYIFRFLTGNLV